MTVLEARRKILNLQAKLDSLSFTPAMFAKRLKLYNRKISKRKTTNAVRSINWACNKLFTQYQQLQNKIDYYLELLKQNPYKITSKDLAISRALELQKKNTNKKESNKKECIITDKKITKLENDYYKFIQALQEYDFDVKEEEKKESLNKSPNPYKVINNRVVDIRYDIKIIDIDISKHSPMKWAEIYHLKLFNSYKYNKTLITEYEFCWALENKLQYMLLNDELAEQKELRAKLIYTDIINNASIEEKEKLKNKFIYTIFIQKQLNNLYN